MSDNNLEKIIKNDSEVILHITLKLDDGSTADSTKVNAKPAKIQLGNGQLTQGIEENLLGLKEKEKKTFTLPPTQAYGHPNPANIHKMSRGQFQSELELVKGNIIEFEQLNGIKLPGIIREIADDQVTVDFNHPLSGQNITFTVEIVSIAPHSQTLLDFFNDQ